MLTNHDKGSVYKEVRLVKFDFSSTNYKLKVTGWRLSIEKKADALFPAVCDRARATAGVDAATAQLEYQDPEVLARANLESESESEGENHERAMPSNLLRALLASVWRRTNSDFVIKAAC